MKEKLKTIFKWIGIGLSIALFVFVVVMAIVKDSEKKYKSIITKIDYESGNNFIAEAEVDSIVQKKFENKIIGHKIKDIKTQDIENEIRKNKYIKEVQIYSTMNNEMVIDVAQKEALTRIINNTGVSYYLTNYGDTIPLSSKFTSRVLIVQGDIRSSDIESILKLSKYIHANDFWRAAVDQVYKGSNGDYEIYTKLGNQNVILGKIDDELENKFEKLKTTYKELLPKVDFDKYKTINLKYKGQVVCSKI